MHGKIVGDKTDLTRTVALYMSASKGCYAPVPRSFGTKVHCMNEGSARMHCCASLFPGCTRQTWKTPRWSGSF
jgi:hypothetical protein